jgi:hypothetical protein
MNPFSALFNAITGVFLTGQQAAAEREQQGSKGRSYDAALKASGDAYYRKHGTYDGWSFDEKTMTGNE